MRTIFRITKTELEVLLFSPVAWILLVIFAVHTGVGFCDVYADELRRAALGYNLYNLTSSIFGGYGGLFTSILNGLYLYIPLLTMNLVSRELSSGSIKLLYSSPVSNFQIIIGKYISVLVVGMVFIAILLLPAIFAVSTMKSPDVPLILTQLLGVYLTICAYGAIGLFMSTTTKYPVVAVVGTLIILSVFSFIGDFGQEYDFIRDITYWLSIKGRSEVFTDGMICTTDLLYFLLVIVLFISLAIIKLQGERLKLSSLRTSLKYAALVVIILGAGYISSRPSMVFYYDSTAIKSNTLSIGSQEVLSKIDSKLTMTTYVNFNDDTYRNSAERYRNEDLKRFEQFRRFKPDLKMKFVYYYGETSDSRLYDYDPSITPKEMMQKICENYETNPNKYISIDEVIKAEDISDEYGRLVRVIETEDGRKARLRVYNDQYVHPFESQITSAFKTLVSKSPMIAFSIGHSERGCQDNSERGYGSFAKNIAFRQSLVNMGFKVCEHSLLQPLPDNVDVLVIADIRSELTPQETANYRSFVAKGGNVFILGEPKRKELTNTILYEVGLRMLDGIVVSPSKEYLDDIVAADFAPVTNDDLSNIEALIKRKKTIITPSVGALEVAKDMGFTVSEVLRTKEKGSWIEKETVDFLNEKSVINEKIGEEEKSNALMLYLNRKVGEKDQRILTIGDADCISNLELGTDRAGLNGANFDLIIEAFRIFSYNEYPVVTKRPRGDDTKIYVTQKVMPYISLFFSWIIPLLLLSYGVLFLMRRKRK